MKTFLLRKKSGRETCDGIVNISADPDFKVIREKDIPALKNPEIIFRWGSSAACPAKFEINSAEMLGKMNNKIVARKILAENQVPIPKTFFTKAEAANGKFPQIGRKSFHSQGEEMQISHNYGDLNNDNISAYWSEFIPKDREFRVYVFFGRILGMCEKIPKDKNKIAWNNSLDNGVFKTVGWKHFPWNVAGLAIKACNVLNVDFSAVDIITKGNDAYILELNSAPTCSEYRQKLFSKAFAWLKSEIIKNKKVPAHFEYPAAIKKYIHVIHPCVLNDAAIEAAEAEEAPEIAVPAAVVKKNVIPAAPIVLPAAQAPVIPAAPQKQVAQVAQKVKSALPDENYNLVGVTDIQFRSVGNKLQIYGKVGGIKNLVKILEVNDPEITHFWED